MKEKYEIEMKKEIKKLQRVRDFFRAAMNNPDIKDKSKPQEARRKVEIVSTIQKFKIAYKILLGRIFLIMPIIP